jgi:hypothetical protein
MRYDAVGNNQKTAFTVTKTNTNTWKTASVVVTDWAFGNSGPSGADLTLVNLDSDDDIFHKLEVIKLAHVQIGTVGMGTVSARTDAVTYSPVVGDDFAVDQRLELTATPAPGWEFTGWSGEVTGTNPRPIFFPTRDSRVTATFAPASVSSSVDNFNSANWTGGSGWSSAWTTTGVATTPGAIAELKVGSSISQITRTLAVPLNAATLSFGFDLDRIGGSDVAKVEIFNGGWQTVWTQTDKGADPGGTMDLVPTTINLSSYGAISQISFTLDSNTSTGRLLIDDVSVTGVPAANLAPQFGSDPISKTPATVAQAYTGQTLAGSAIDPNSNPLTFTKLPGGPTWLSVAPNGALSGTPAPTDAGLNRWTVQVSSSGGTDTATLLIDVVAPGPNPPSGLSYSSPPVYTKGVAIANLSPSTSGGGVVRYTATPKLPSGLRLNSTTGLISGTPLAPTPAATYTITATNTDGSTTASVSFTVVSPYAAWAAQYGLVQNLEGDDDGDGNSNYFEFVAGLVPTNAGSVFKTTVSYLPGQPSQRAIVFSPIISGRNYSVKSSESLQPATWIPLSGAISSDAGNERTVVDTAANEARKFYVIEIKNP